MSYVPECEPTHRPLAFYFEDGISMKVQMTANHPRGTSTSSIDIHVMMHDAALPRTYEESWLPTLTIPIQIGEGEDKHMSLAAPLVRHVYRAQEPSVVYALSYNAEDGTGIAALSRIVKYEQVVTSGGLRLQVVGDSARDEHLLEQYGTICSAKERCDWILTLNRVLKNPPVAEVQREPLIDAVQ